MRGPEPAFSRTDRCRRALTFCSPVPLLCVVLRCSWFCFCCAAFDWNSAFQYKRCTALNVAWVAVWTLN